jgi:tripartite-type tricarboxylate transporter receptor subunit TctC
MKRLLSALAIVVATVSVSAGPVAAQNFPTRNLKIVVPFAPGGAVDFTSRLIAEAASTHSGGHKIVIENLPGGGAVIGQTAVANAKPDGYTLLAYTSSVINNPLTKKTTFTYKSFTPVFMYCFDPDVVVVAANSPFKTIGELVEAAKKREVSVATPGYSTSHHIAGLILTEKTGAKFGYIHNESAAMQFQQLMGGHVEVAFVSGGEALGYTKDGSVRALGIISKSRTKEFPATPTFKESGIDMEWGTFRGMAVPAATPGKVVAALEQIMKKATENPTFVNGMTKAGYPIDYRGSREFAAYVDGEAKVMEEILPKLKK